MKHIKRLDEMLNPSKDLIDTEVKTVATITGTSLNDDGTLTYDWKNNMYNITIPVDSILIVKKLPTNSIDAVVSWENKLYNVNKSSLFTRAKPFKYSDKLSDLDNKTGIFN